MTMQKDIISLHEAYDKVNHNNKKLIFIAEIVTNIAKY